jgi:predicted phage terminase large subunit-like protein
LQQFGLQAVGVKDQGKKRDRMSVQSAKFESGQVLFPKSASWLEVLEAELFAFPGSRHDDQVDSISQALAHAVGGYDTTGSWW